MKTVERKIILHDSTVLYEDGSSFGPACETNLTPLIIKNEKNIYGNEIEEVNIISITENKIQEKFLKFQDTENMTLIQLTNPDYQEYEVIYEVEVPDPIEEDLTD